MAPYFEKPEIDLAGKRIIGVFTAYREAERIPFFLDYYRRMGVDHFLAIDNNSPDRTRELLLNESDVSYFHTAGSYVASKAGRLWTSELADHYCNGRWCLTLDLDEQLVFPGCERATLRDLCDYLDEYSFDGIFTVFLDMYHAGPLSDAIYKPGQPFLEVCDHFEPTTYTLRPPMHFPYVGVFGGPRQRIFWEQGKKGRGPSQRKLPLIKWRPGFKYVTSTHACSPIRLADITGVLLHFKFFSSFASFAERELARGDRVQTEDYEKYARLAKEQGLNFKSDRSVRYESSVTLVEHGVAVCSRDFLNWLRPRLNRMMGVGPARRFDALLRNALKGAEERATLTLANLPGIWPLLAGRTEGGIISVWDRRVLGWFSHRSGHAPAQEIEARVQGEVVAIGVTGTKLWKRAAVKPEQRDLAFELTVPEAAFDRADTVRVAFAAKGDSLPFASVVLNRTGEIASADQFDGACRLSPERRIEGWAWSPQEPGRTVGLDLHIDGQYWQQALANAVVEDLKEGGIRSGAHGFSLDLPEALDPQHPHDIRLVIHGTNFQLPGSPLTMPPARHAEPDAWTAISSYPPFETAYAVSLPRFDGGFAGRIIAIRRGTIYGWVLDTQDPSRHLDVELVAGGRVRRVVVASAMLSFAGEAPSEARGHGFVIPVSSSWLPRPLQEDMRHVSLRVAGREGVLAEDLVVAGLRLNINRSTYRGSCEANHEAMLRGWVWQSSAPAERVEVALFIDHAFLTVVRADGPRSDLLAAGVGNGAHGFAVPVPERFLTGTEHIVHAVTAREGIALRNSPCIIVGRSVRLRRPRRSMPRLRRGAVGSAASATLS